MRVLDARPRPAEARTVIDNLPLKPKIRIYGYDAFEVYSSSFGTTGWPETGQAPFQ
jgi:hypothetical protein